MILSVVGTRSLRSLVSPWLRSVVSSFQSSMPTSIFKRIMRTYIKDETNDILKYERRREKEKQLHQIMNLAFVSLTPEFIDYDSEATEEDDEYKDPTYILGLRLKWA